MGENETDFRPHQQGGDSNSPKMGPWETQWMCRLPLETDRDEKRMGRGACESHRNVGPITGGPIWLHRPSDMSVQQPGVGWKESIACPKGARDRRDINFTHGGENQRDASTPPGGMGEHGGYDNPSLEGCSLVAKTRSFTNSFHPVGPPRLQRTYSLGATQWSSQRVDGILDPNKDSLLAPRTIKAYRETLSRYFRWCWDREERGGQEEGNEQTVRNIEEYLSYLATVTSGEYVLRTWRILKASLLKNLHSHESEQLEQRVQLLRRDANIKHPVKYRAADAIRLEDLNEIMAQIQYAKLSYKEQIAMEILCVAFATMSRVAEISVLTIDDIYDGGTTISIRPKTYAKTCKRQVKKLTDMGFIRAATFVKQRRNTAIRKGCRLLFSAKENADKPMSSSTVSNVLRRIMKKN